MELEEYLNYFNSGKEVDADSEFQEMSDFLLQEATRIKMKLNNEFHPVEEVREIFAELTSKPVNESLRLIPPFHTDCGKNIHIGRNVFINSNCSMQDQGGIYIGDEVFIGHNVSLLTLNHNLNPQKRANLIPSPIYLEDHVWLGSNVTILPGVRVGKNSVVAAGAVVSKDVPANTVVGGIPAKIIKKIDV